MVKTIDATTTDRLRRSPLYSDLSPSCAPKRACMELTTICRFQRLWNLSFRLIQCIHLWHVSAQTAIYQRIGNMPKAYPYVMALSFWEIWYGFLPRIHFVIRGFSPKASGFYPWGNVDSPRKRVAEGLCGWRHGNSFPMTQSAQSHRQMRSIPRCSKAVF